MKPTDAPLPAALLEMQRVSCPALRSPGSMVAEGVNWRVTAGEFWVIGGVQRSGKTDFLMMTAGLMSPAAGTYHFGGKPMPFFEESRLAERLKLGLVSETGQLFKHLTIAENVALPLRYHRNLSLAEAMPLITPWLAVLGLERWASRTAAQLPWHWQKCAALARALTLAPELLLLDNPLGGVEARHRARLLGLLDELAAGHPLRGGQPLTLVATADDFRPWRQHTRSFALLAGRRFTTLGNWTEVQASPEAAVRELCHALPTDD